MKISIVFACVFICIVYMFFPILFRFLLKKEKFNKVISWFFIFVYLFVLSFGVFTNFYISIPYIYLSFKPNANWASEAISFDVFGISLTDLFLNLVILIPIGVVFTLLSFYKNSNFNKRKLFFNLFFIGLSYGFFIELMQFILPIKRSIQLSDVLLNAISCLLGGLYFLILLKIKRNKKKEQ